MDENTIPTEITTEIPVETPTEISTEVPAEPTEPQEDYSFLKKLRPETVQYIKEHGENWDRKVNRENQQVIELRKKYEKLISEAESKPPQATQRAELETLKAMLKQRVKDGEVNSDYADSLVKDFEQELSHPPIEDQVRPIVERQLEEFSKLQRMSKAQEDLVLASKGELDNDDAFGMLNGLMANGKTIEEAVERVKGLFKSVETNTLKNGVKEIMDKPKTKIIPPGTNATNGGDSQNDIVERVKAKALADAKAGV